jgi:hypothetical protein
MPTRLFDPLTINGIGAAYNFAPKKAKITLD